MLVCNQSKSASLMPVTIVTDISLNTAHIYNRLSCSNTHRQVSEVFVCLLTHWKPLCRRPLSQPVSNADADVIQLPTGWEIEREEGSVCWGLFVRNCTLLSICWMSFSAHSSSSVLCRVWPRQILWRHETRKSLKVVTPSKPLQQTQRKSVRESFRVPQRWWFQ